MASISSACKKFEDEASFIMSDNLNLLKICVKEGDLGAIHNMLKLFSSNTSVDMYRDCVTTEFIRLVARVLNNMTPTKDVQLLDDAKKRIVAECFRGLRNVCVRKPLNQSYIAEETSALENAHDILQAFKDLESEEAICCMETGLQFYCNMVVKNKKNQLLIWNKYSRLIKSIISMETMLVRFINFASMVLYTILLDSPELYEETDADLFEALIGHTVHSEYACFAIELLLQKEGFMEEIYSQISVDKVLLLLESAHELMSKTSTPSAEGMKMPVSSIAFLSQQFKTQSDCILKTVAHYADNLEPREVAKLLEILASASSVSLYMEEVQKDMSLLINCAFLLKSMHSLGKSGENNFTAIQNLSMLAPAGGNEEIQSHPAFGVKCNLVRLLGNLCWKHKTNQDQARDLDCIPLLLDCCNMDARNPLIIQWVVMAMRNLCEANAENQALIAAMNRRGTVSSAVLMEMGLTLQGGADTINIVPLIKNN